MKQLMPIRVVCVPRKEKKRERERKSPKSSHVSSIKACLQKYEDAKLNAKLLNGKTYGS